MTEDVCSRCVLRAKNVRRHSAYEVQTEENGSPCSVCLGVLQEPTLTAITSAFSDLVAPITHANEIKVNATFPPAISVVRDRAFSLAVTGKRYPSLSIDATGDDNGEAKPLVTPMAPIPLREVFKWTVSARLARVFGICYSPDSQLFLDVTFSHPGAGTDIGFIVDRCPPQKVRRRNETHVTTHSASHIMRVVDAMDDTEFSKHAAHLIPPPPVKDAVKVATAVSVDSAFLAGSYKKWSRIVSQTPWNVESLATGNCDDDSRSEFMKNKKDKEHTDKAVIVACLDDNSRYKRTSLSVEDVVLLGIREVLQSQTATFSAGGREDIDVRMLGDGRPFMVEVTNPRTIPSLITDEHVRCMKELSHKSSTTVSINDLKVVTRAYSTQMKAFEAEKRKCYRCVVWCQKPFSESALCSVFERDDGFVIQQRTPLRVLHRRTQAVRKRQVYSVKVSRFLSSNYFMLDIVAQAGTYIKEFIHSDHGRTQPNVCSLLGCDADILQLDVLRVDTQEAS